MLKKPASAMQLDFGSRLRRCRIALGFGSQAAFARSLGVKKDTYHLWEKGLSTPQTISDLDNLCQAIGITSDYLLFGETRGLSDRAYDLFVRPDREQGRDVT